MDFAPFIGGSYVSQAVTADNEETINWYAEELQSAGAPRKYALYPTPGVTALSSAGIGPGRAHFAMNGREFVVLKDTLYEVSSGGVLTSRGTVGDDDKPATISSNGDLGNQLFITSTNNGYVYNLLTNTLTQIVAMNGRCTMGDYLDGYFLALDAATATLYISKLGDGATWAPGSDFAQRSAQPDLWVSMKVVGRFLWLFGSLTSEVWQDVGAVFPFAPNPSGNITFGCAAPFSPKVIGNDVIWLATNANGRLCVARAASFSPTVISTYPLEAALATYGSASGALADIYSDLGHTFYVLSFDRDGVTWAWDEQTGLWAKRGTWVAAEGRYVAWRPRFYAHAFGEHRILDASSGQVFRLDSASTTDADGGTIRRVRRAPAISKENQRIYFPLFELDLEPGLGNAVAPGDDPQVALRLSNDGGKTWGPAMFRSAGTRGQYNRRVRWLRLGSARRRVFEVVVSDPIPWRLTGAYVEAHPGKAAN